VNIFYQLVIFHQHESQASAQFHLCLFIIMMQMDFVPDSSSSREGDNNETSGGTNQKRDDDEEDDQLSEDDFELVEENFGSKMKVNTSVI
jgi:hypothetical protein